MPIVDRYILAQFVQVFCICFISLTGLYVVIDAFGNLDEFLSHADKYGGLFQVLGSYYGYRSLAFFDRISGILALISAMFTVTWIQRHQEMTALMAAGLPAFRIVTPVVIAAASISGLAMANREWVIPQIRENLSRNAQDLDGNKARELLPRYDNETDVLLRGHRAYAGEQRIEKPRFMLPAGLDRYGKHLVAENAYYQPPRNGRPGGYLLRGVSEPEELIGGPSLAGAAGPVVLTPASADWLADDECFVVSDVSFEMLQGGYAWKNFSSTSELIRGLRTPSLDFGADVRVTIHARLVQPLLDVNLLFLGLPLILTRNNRNVFVAIGLCAGLGVLFMLIVLGCQYLGASYWLSPALGAWLPLMIFVPLAVFMSEPLRQ